MKRTVTLGVVWLVAAAVAVTVAWQGVSVVGDQVTDERPAPLAASDIEARLAEEAATSTTTADASSTSTTTSTTVVSTDTSASGGGPVPTTPTTTAPVPTVVPTTTVPAPATETRTYNLVGGTAALRFSPSGVTVVFANPAPGFSVEVEPEHGNGVKVEFESESHESRVDGWWDGGPVDRVDERPED